MRRGRRAAHEASAARAHRSDRSNGRSWACGLGVRRPERGSRDGATTRRGAMPGLPAAALVRDRVGDQHGNGQETESGIRLATVRLRGLLDRAAELRLRLGRGGSEIQRNEAGPASAGAIGVARGPLETQAGTRAGRRQRGRWWLDELAQIVVDRGLRAEIQARGAGGRRHFAWARGVLRLAWCSSGRGCGRERFRAVRRTPVWPARWRGLPESVAPRAAAESRCARAVQARPRAVRAR